MKTESFIETLFGLTGRVAVIIGGTGELCGAIAPQSSPVPPMTTATRPANPNRLPR